MMMPMTMMPQGFMAPMSMQQQQQVNFQEQQQQQQQQPFFPAPGGAPPPPMYPTMVFGWPPPQGFAVAGSQVMGWDFQLAKKKLNDHFLPAQGPPSEYSEMSFRGGAPLFGPQQQPGM